MKLYSIIQIPQQNLCETPPSEEITIHHFRLAIKLRYLGNHASLIEVTMERYQEVMVAISESVMKNRLKRTLAVKSR